MCENSQARIKMDLRAYYVILASKIYILFQNLLLLSQTLIVKCSLDDFSDFADNSSTLLSNIT